MLGSIEVIDFVGAQWWNLLLRYNTKSSEQDSGDEKSNCRQKGCEPISVAARFKDTFTNHFYK